MPIITDFGAWRCKHDDSLFCPIEGCPKSYGCARDKGWQPGQPSPRECMGLRRPLSPQTNSSGLHTGSEHVERNEWAVPFRPQTATCTPPTEKE